MTKADEKLITRAAISELERLSLLLDTELEVTASMSAEEAEDGLRQMGLNPNQPLTKTPAHVYVSDEPLHNECSDEVKLLILEVRHLANQQRYGEALDLAILATQVDPNYWRAWISRGTLLVLFGEVDAGDKIFDRVAKEFSGNPKAVAAGLHGRAWVKEIRCGLDPSADALQEVTNLYEEALRLDSSRANTRASLLIHSMMSDGADDKAKLLKDSLLREGFFDALRFELTERGARASKALQALPAWLRRLLFPIRPLLGRWVGSTTNDGEMKEEDMKPQNFLKTVTSIIIVVVFALASNTDPVKHRGVKALLDRGDNQGSYVELAKGGQIGRLTDDDGGQIG